MQATLPLGQAADLYSLRGCLKAAFAPIRDAERLDPASQFVRSFIASRTYDRTSWNAFVRLGARYRSWDALADAPAQEIEAELAGITFPEKKAPELKLALRKIRARAGGIDLDFLADQPVEQALFWLEQIHGVGRKIAAATLNFSTLRKRAFVVDGHVLRVMRRFGFVKPNADEIAVFDAVMAAASGLDADGLYELHWHVKALGQRICTHSRALCASCPLSHMCSKRVEGALQSGHAA